MLGDRPDRRERQVRARDAERAARRFIEERYPGAAHWNFDICDEENQKGRGKSWSFGLSPDEEDPDYEPGRSLTGYVHADGTIEGMH